MKKHVSAHFILAIKTFPRWHRWVRKADASNDFTFKYTFLAKKKKDKHSYYCAAGNFDAAFVLLCHNFVKNLNE